MDDLIEKLDLFWISKGIKKCDLKKQISKLMEEVVELNNEVLDYNHCNTRKEIADVFIALENICLLTGIDLKDVVEEKFEIIKERKLTLKKGVIVKDE